MVILRARIEDNRNPWWAAFFDSYGTNMSIAIGMDERNRFKAHITGAYGGHKTTAFRLIIDNLVRELPCLPRRKYVFAARPLGPAARV